MKPIEYYFLFILFLIFCIVIFAVSLEISCRYDEWKSNKKKDLIESVMYPFRR